MSNSSSSKYVKRHAHRHTKSRRHAKKYTIKKVMRGCSSKQVGGAELHEVNMPPNANRFGNADNITDQTGNLLQLEALKKATGGMPPAAAPPVTPNINGNNTVQKGGYKSKHRRRRYKKSIGRKGRSRRFRGSRK